MFGETLNQSELATMIRNFSEISKTHNLANLKIQENLELNSTGCLMYSILVQEVLHSDGHSDDDLEFFLDMFEYMTRGLKEDVKEKVWGLR